MEIRKSYLDGSISFITPHRKSRPHAVNNKKKCPFCRGNEYLTPPTIIQYSKKGKWEIRVVENLFPIVSPKAGKPTNSRFYASLRAYGFHEVVIDHYKHEKRFWQFSPKHIENWIKILLERYADLKSKRKIKYVFIFKNFGNKSARSIEHEHTQIVALPIIPTRVKDKIMSLKKYYIKNDECFLCSLSREKRFLIKENKHFSLVYNPVPIIENQMLIIPKRHFSEFDEIRKNEMSSLAKSLKHGTKLTARYSYNLAFFPFMKKEKYLHFHIEILPRKQVYGSIELVLQNYVISSLI
ncbi:MAG: DUF4931 domain-containing protein [Candidatus Aenigmarchaeota archaeon]|nr:DUF4931 domain-containing protein [Candidatus Aenigmarchaeota archaeon]